MNGTYVGRSTRMFSHSSNVYITLLSKLQTGGLVVQERHQWHRLALTTRESHAALSVARYMHVRL